MQERFHHLKTPMSIKKIYEWTVHVLHLDYILYICFM